MIVGVKRVVVAGIGDRGLAELGEPISFVVIGIGEGHPTPERKSGKAFFRGG